MPSYKLEYVLHTGVVAGRLSVHSKVSLKTKEFEASDDDDAARKASIEWPKVLYEHKEPGSAVQFIGLLQKLDWKPEDHQVVWQKPGESAVFFK